jgi:hypothetical protein
MAEPENTTDMKTDQPTGSAESGEDLRDTAYLLEVAAGESLADLSFPLSTGNLQEFPRPSPELRAAEKGLETLQDTAARAVSMLHVLAAAREQGLEIPPVLRAAVERFIATVRVHQ